MSQGEVGWLKPGVSEKDIYAFIHDPQFVAPRAHLGHRPRMRKRQDLTPLKLAEEVASLDARRLPERRGLHLSVEPSEGLVPWAHLP